LYDEQLINCFYATELKIGRFRGFQYYFYCKHCVWLCYRTVLGFVYGCYDIERRYSV